MPTEPFHWEGKYPGFQEEGADGLGAAGWAGLVGIIPSPMEVAMHFGTLFGIAAPGERGLAANSGKSPGDAWLALTQELRRCIFDLASPLPSAPAQGAFPFAEGRSPRDGEGRERGSGERETLPVGLGAEGAGSLSSACSQLY